MHMIVHVYVSLLLHMAEVCALKVCFEWYALKEGECFEWYSRS